jgi:hypothetical protein
MHGRTYETQAEAEAQAEVYRVGWPNVIVFYCALCQGWHLTLSTEAKNENSE